MGRSILKPALGIGFGLLVALGILEAGIRLLGLAPNIDPIVLDRPYASFESSPNAILRYVPKPGAAGISAYGLRDRDYPLAKQAGTYRIVVLGDSIAFGYCSPTEFVAPTDTFPKLLEQRLNDPVLEGHDRVEVINLSVSGYGTAQEIEFLRVKGLAFEPNLVLLAYCLNDSEESSTELTEFREQESFGTLELFRAEVTEAIFLESALVRAVWYQVRRLRPTTASEPAAEIVDPQKTDPRESGFDALRVMAEDARFKTVVAIFPNLYSFKPYAYRADHIETTRSAEARSFAVIDLLGPFNRASGGAVAHIRGRCTSVHPDENGHRIAAEALEQFVRALPAPRQR